MSYETGDVVISLAGHDKGTCYVVVGKENDIFLLANGKTKLMDSPKHKKPKHLNKVASLDERLVQELKSQNGAFAKNRGTADSELRNALKALGYNNSNIMIKRYLHE